MGGKARGWVTRPSTAGWDAQGLKGVSSLTIGMLELTGMAFFALIQYGVSALLQYGAFALPTLSWPAHLAIGVTQPPVRSSSSKASASHWLCITLLLPVRCR